LRSGLGGELVTEKPLNLHCNQEGGDPGVNSGTVAQGWYQDPYVIHEHRYFSAGLPTKLVRDGGHESYDPPPDGPFPDGELVPAAGTTEEAGGAEAEQSALSKRMQRAVFDYFNQLIKQ
jgi:hypothetical protein